MFRETVLAIVRERYSDFGPTLAAEKLSELHGVDLGVETLRQWMIDAGLGFGERALTPINLNLRTKFRTVSSSARSSSYAND